MDLEIRTMERERGYYAAATPLGLLLSMLLLLVALDYGRVAWLWFAWAVLFTAYSAFGWWLFWIGCRDYDRKHSTAIPPR